jgi:hypothetical protein
MAPPRTLVFLLSLVAACRPATPESPLPVTRDDPPTEIPRLALPGVLEAESDAARRTLATAHFDRSFGIVRDGVERSWPMRRLMAEGECGFVDDPMLGYLDVGVSPDGREAWFLALEGSKTPPYHVLSAACLVDVDSGIPRSLRRELGEPAHLRADRIEADGMPALALGRRVGVLWGPVGDLELIRRGSRRVEELDVGAHDGDCRVAERGAELVVACVADREGGRLTIARFDLAKEPSRPVAHVTLLTRATYPKLVLAADGRYAGFFEWSSAIGEPSWTGVVDVDEGRVLFEQLERRRVTTMEFSSGPEALLVAYEGGRVRRLGLEGGEEASFELGCRARALFGESGGASVWCLTYGDGLSLFAMPR